MNVNRVRATMCSAQRPRNATEQNGDIVTGFAAAEGVVAHGSNMPKRAVVRRRARRGRSGAFYIYDRRQGSFWLLELADGVFGGYSYREMARKIRDFRLLDFAENPARLTPVR